MAYIVGSASVQNHSASTTCGTVTIPTHAQNDLIVIVASQDVASATGISTATANWNNQGTVTGAPAGAAHQRIITRLASAPATSAPTITSTANAAWTTVCFIVRDVDTTTPVEVVSSQTDWNLAKTANSATVTPLSGETLAIYSWVCDGTTQMKCKLSDLTPIAKDSTAAIGVIVGYKQLPPGTSTTSAVQMRTTTASEGGSSWVILIKNSSGGRRQPDIQVTANEFEDFGDFGTAITWGKPTDFATSGLTIGSLGLSTTVPTVVTNVSATASPWGRFTSITNGDNTSGIWAGGTYSFSATNMSSRVAYLEWYTSTETQTGARLGSEGAILAFMDGSGNWIAYQLRPKSSFPIASGTSVYSFVALGNATSYAGSGTVDWTNITRLGVFWHRTGSSATTGTFLVKNLHLFSSFALTGGNSTSTADWLDAYDWIHGWGHFKLIEKQASAQLMAKFSAAVGDGSRLTAIDMSAQAIEYPVTYSASNQPDWNVNAGTQTLSVYASASDVINYTASLAVTETQQALTINASSSTSASYNFTGTSFVGWAPTWKTGVTCANATFSGCDTVNFSGASLTNVTVKAPNSNVGASDAACSFDTSSAVLTGCTINLSGAAGSPGYHLELGTSVTSITLTDCTFSGSAGTNKVHVMYPETTVAATALVTGRRYKIKTVGTSDFTLVGASANTVGTEFTATGTTTGTGDAYAGVTITITGTTSLANGDITKDAANTPVYISGPTINQSVTISGATAGTRIQIYDTTSSTELYNGTPTFPYTWTDASPAVADRAIRLRAAYVSGTSAKNFIEASIGTCGTTSGTESVSYLVNQTNDTVYNNNAINGSTVTGVTFTDAATDKINIDVAAATISWKTIYAAWVYYAFGATGIATDIDYIDAVDEANYLLSNLLVKNTSSPSVPLEITGGYGRDATTLAAIDLMDTTGGTIFVAPDHVVSYAVGSGVTSQDITDIATEVLTQAATAPIHADIKKVNSYSVTGDGQTGTEWGPA